MADLADLATDLTRACDLLSEALRCVIHSKNPQAPEELRSLAAGALAAATDMLSAGEKSASPAPKPVFAWVAYYPDWSGVAIFRDELDAYKHAVDQHMKVVGVRDGGDPRDALDEVRHCPKCESPLSEVRNWIGSGMPAGECDDTWHPANRRGEVSS